MIGADGVALTAMEPGQTGRVLIRGEIWTATATESIALGDRVRATDVDGLRLTIRRHDTVSPRRPESSGTSGDGETSDGE
jgi:membrane protein implicated in regulation of membrane protease activity